MQSSEICNKFFSFFSKRGHTIVPGSPVIPADDPTLLFTNAGMNQFKDVFLGREKRSYSRAVSIQKCVRAGGKHNDLDNVGFTKRHLTFFEMMGNFSFGDYFKQEAIRLAWDFLTHDLHLDIARLWATVYEHDHEAYELWQEFLPRERIIKLGTNDNFWQMGNTGPCGPCSEIYIDQGGTIGCQQTSCAPGCSCDRFLEIWNLVFMQFDRQKDGTDKLLALKSVDTGMGLERLCTILQNTSSVFETDIFAPILQKIEELTGILYKTATLEQQAAFRVIADHIRSTACAIAEGCTPAPDGRGYVIRKIIRRAALFAHKLSSQSFFPYVTDGLMVRYPELKPQRDFIVAVLEKESEQFSRNLIRGKQLLEEYIAEHRTIGSISGVMAFTLYDTYGFPLELTRVIAHDHGMAVDEDGFKREMERQRSLSGLKETNEPFSIDPAIVTTFTGYNELSTTSSIQVLMNEQLVPVTASLTGQIVWIIPAACPFYAESGGQVSDTGTVQVQGATYPIMGVKKQGHAIAFAVQAATPLYIGDELVMHVDESNRRAAMKNHTATHLLQAALMHVLGKGIKQSGSLVTPDYVRFDFTYSASLSTEQICAIERFVNQAIWNNSAVTTQITTLAEAHKQGVIAFFGEKYNPDNVRVVKIGIVSAELCGGTHVAATGELGLFKISEISAPSTGNRRIVARTGPRALEDVQAATQTLKLLSSACKTSEHDLVNVVKKQQAQLKDTQQQLRRVQRTLWKAQMPLWIENARIVNNISYGVIILENITSEDTRDLAQALAQSKPGLWTVIATEPHHEQISFAMALTPELRKHHNLRELLANHLVPLGLKGGGSDIAIQGGAGRLPESLEESIRKWLENQL